MIKGKHWTVAKSWVAAKMTNLCFFLDFYSSKFKFNDDSNAQNVPFFLCVFCLWRSFNFVADENWIIELINWRLMKVNRYVNKVHVSSESWIKKTKKTEEKLMTQHKKETIYHKREWYFSAIITVEPLTEVFF